jgi:antitoxin HigA-1
VSYRDRRTERFASGQRVKEFSGFARQAEMRLDRLDAAASLADLAGLPGNRLEALKGDRAGQFSIRTNDQWRICFAWPDGMPGPVEVEIVDYHWGKTIVPRTPIHPGEHLAEELRELGLSAAELSRQIDVPVNRITGIIHGQRGITADTALRLGHWFGTSPQFWMNLQQNYELRLAESQVGAKIAVLPRRTMRPTSRKIGKTAW